MIWRGMEARHGMGGRTGLAGLATGGHGNIPWKRQRYFNLCDGPCALA